MTEIKFQLPAFSMDHDNNAYEVLTMKRGKQRRMSYHAIIIETLRALGDQRPTRDQLQKFSKIRRKRFIMVLKQLLETESVKRNGSGTRCDPYKYALGEKEIRQ